MSMELRVRWETAVDVQGLLDESDDPQAPCYLKRKYQFAVS